MLIMLPVILHLVSTILYVLETKYPYEEYHWLLLEQQSICWNNYITTMANMLTQL